MYLFCSFLEEYESLYEEASTNVGKYIANPINAYLLVKRLTADWKQVEGVMTQNTGPGNNISIPFGLFVEPRLIIVLQNAAFIHNITQHRGVLHFPSDEDLNGAAMALMRLQDTYMLDTHDLAEGELQGKKYSRQLTGKEQESESFFSSC